MSHESWLYFFRQNLELRFFHQNIYQNLLSPTFLDVFFDVDSDKKKTFDFWQFFDRDIAVFLPTLKNFNPKNLETGTFLGRTVTCVEFVSKNALKWAKVVFFEKKSPNNLNLVNYFSPSSRCLVIDENFLKNRLNMVYFVQNFSLIIFLVFKEYNLVPPTHKLAKNSRKMVKIAIFYNFSLILVKFNKKIVEINKDLVEINKGLVKINKGLVEINKGLVEINKGLV